jgi:triosephosphate isomerase
MNRQKIVAGNWKMHKTLEESQALITEVRGIVRDEYRGEGKVVLIPTFLALPSAVRLLEGSGLLVGAQNAHQADQGAFTGEISAGMLKSLGVQYCLVGHSERRQFFGETNEVCALKVKSVIRHGMKPIFCIGETLEQRESKQYFRAIEEQIVQGLFHLDRKEFAEVVIAYEPVWAIGTGKVASAQVAQDMHHAIRHQLAEFDVDVASHVGILYGGSVKPDNAVELFAMPDIDGGLVGGASLDPQDFLAICKA